MFKNLYTIVLSYINAQKARESLQSMDNRMLADIGISRSEIDYVIKNDRNNAHLYL